MPFAAVLSVGDRPTVLAARAAARLGLAGNPVDAAEASVDKREAREALRLCRPDRSLASRRSCRRRRLAMPRATSASTFPCVLKPTGLSGSRGVIRADTVEEFVAAAVRDPIAARASGYPRGARRIRTTSWSKSSSPGREYAVEGVLTRGSLHVFAIFDKPDPLDGPFFEETIYVTPSALGEPRARRCATPSSAAPGRSGFVTARSTRSSAISPGGDRAARDRVAADRRIVFERARFEGGASLEDVLLRSRARRRRDAASPRARGVGGDDDSDSEAGSVEAGGGSRARARPAVRHRRAHHRQAGPVAGTAAGGRQLSGVHLRERAVPVARRTRRPRCAARI